VSPAPSRPRRLVLTVTLNAALDLTYRVDRLTPGATHRVEDIAARAGGKGVNVARVLHALGEPVLATGLAGGATGARLRALLAADGVPEEFVPIADESRRTVVICAGDGAEPTGFWEPGPRVTATEWRTFVERYQALLAGSSVVTLNGSLPPGVPQDGYATLIALARAAGVPTVLDADGEPLRLGVAAGPDLVKPNALELSMLHGAALGRKVLVDSPAGAEAAAAAARELGAGAVVASLASVGVVAATGDGCWHAAPPERVNGNPTGAGDACVAGLARGLLLRQAWPERLRDAVALSAAAVASPVAGEFSFDDYQRLYAAVSVQPLPPARKTTISTEVT